ncbi:MAG: hypothetical protein AAF739_00260 [Pseudomonadota bacterium]
MSRFETVSHVLQAEFEKPYAYGVSDCFLTGLTVADAVRGSKLVGDFQGRYSTLRGAHRVLRNEGHTSLVTLFQGMFEPIAPARAAIGDLGIYALPVEGSKRAAEHVGVHDGRNFRIKGENGPITFAYTQALAAFRV